jgi:hypothetical protein
MGFSHAANLGSILIAAVAAWIFGGVYYTALSKPWMAAQGKTLEQCKAEQDAKSGIAKGTPFVIVFVSEIIIAWVLYGILLHLKYVYAARRHYLGPLLLVRLCVDHDRDQQRFSGPSRHAHGHRRRRLARCLCHHRRHSRLVGSVRAREYRESRGNPRLVGRAGTVA